MPEEIIFRPIARSDFPLLRRWLREPHVDAWWHTPLDLAGLEDRYGPRIDGLEPAYVFVIEYGKRDIGIIQWYRLSDYPTHALQINAEPGAAGIDFFIGEASLLGLGIGPTLIREFIRRAILTAGDVSSVVTDPGVENTRSIRALEKVGFVRKEMVQRKGESMTRQIMYLCISTGTAQR